MTGMRSPDSQAGLRGRAGALIITLAIAGCAATALSVAPGGAGEPTTALPIAHRDDMGPDDMGPDDMGPDDMGPGRDQAPPPTAAASQEARPPTSSSPPVPARLREPISLALPDMGVEAPVTATGMDEGGIIAVPEDVLVTAWFDGSRRLGAPYGSTVIVGHRDSATQGSGALYAIEDVPLGALLTVTDRGGRQHRYVVESVEFVDKTALPAEAPRIFTHRGPHRLVLITCGGDFDEEARSYLSNVVVTALPAPASRG
jgi:hypothetical protein